MPANASDKTEKELHTRNCEMSCFRLEVRHARTHVYIRVCDSIAMNATKKRQLAGANGKNLKQNAPVYSHCYQVTATTSPRPI